MTVLNFAKKYKEFYLPKEGPSLVDIPRMRFIMVDGMGDPNNNESYNEAIQILYSLSYTIKMSKLKGEQPEGYFDYVVPPLEGLWGTTGGMFYLDKRDNWAWTAMIRQPDFVTEQVFCNAVTNAKNKKPNLDYGRAILKEFTEGLCVQMLHIGPYATEPITMKAMQEFMEQNDLIDEVGNIRRHHEVYLSDPRRVSGEKLKTVLRHPVKKM